RVELEEEVMEAARDAFHRKIDSFGEHGERVMSFILLSTIDDKWKDHLYDLDHLKASIGFRGWGQKDPLVEYKQEAFDMFVDLMNDLRATVSQNLFRAQMTAPRRAVRPQPMTFSGPADTPATGAGELGHTVTRAGESQETPSRAAAVDEMGIARKARADTSGTPSGLGGLKRGLEAFEQSAPDVRRLATNRGDEGERKQKPVTAEEEPGRNDPCWCGSGKKYKKCHGRKAG
ncbi:MAG TPA: SEC-C metal-binding domain-containing protein, partial [Longimicrobiales bacterium]|nr:SEC-C metal-binding domain-containing protein [Longimicrobiales bacterium]